MAGKDEKTIFWQGVRGISIGVSAIIIVLLTVSVLSWWQEFSQHQTEAVLNWSRACTEPLECTRKDLVAQQRVADSTAANVHLSLLAMVLNGLAAAFVGATLIYTVRSARAATAAAEAAQRGLELTEDNTQREIRAYVIAKLEPEPLTLAAGDFLTVPIRIRNCGSTPAYKVKTFVRLELVREGSVIMASDMDDSDDVSAILGPDESFAVWSHALHAVTVEDIEGLRSGDLIIRYSGRVTYVDVFGHNQWLTFSARFVEHPLVAWWEATGNAAS